MTGPGHDQFSEMAGLFVVGALEPGDRARFEAHLRECDVCAAEVRSLTPVVEGLARAAPMREPPAALRARVLSAVAGDARVEGQPRIDRHAARSPWSRAGWMAAAASLLLAAALGYVAASRQQRIVDLEARLRDATARLASAAQQVAGARRAVDEQASAALVLSAPDLVRIDLGGQPAAAMARGRAFWSRARGMVLSAASLPPLPPGKIYQAWVLTPTPVSAGLFASDAAGNARLVVKTPEDIPNPTAVAVTIEPAGGVPAPTGTIYLAGPVAP